MNHNVLQAALLMLATTVVGAASAAGWANALTITAVSDTDYGGELVDVTVAQPVDNSAGCAAGDFYVIRDPTIIKGSLALLTAALLAGRPANVFVSGTCDSSGRPNVTGVSIQ